MENLIEEKAMKMSNAREDGMYEEMVKFGEYFRSKYGISPSTAISVILGCVCLFMFVKRRWERKHQKPYTAEPTIQGRSKKIARLYGGDLALRRLAEHHIANVIPETLERSDLVLRGLLEEHHLDLKKLQIVTARLEMAGREEEGVEILKEAKRKNAEEKKSHHVYEIDMLLVELLIYTGRHAEAKNCECLKDQKVIELDARRPLFKALIYGMQGKYDPKAKNNWDKFIYLRQAILSGVGEGEPLPAITDFHQFKNKVQNLQKQIEKKKRVSAKKI